MHANKIYWKNSCTKRHSSVFRKHEGIMYIEFEYKGFQLVLFVIHSDIAVKLSLSNLQSVCITPKFSSKDSTENENEYDQQIKRSVPGIKRSRQVIPHIILSDP
jgi:hypothetical protein